MLKKEIEVGQYVKVLGSLFGTVYEVIGIFDDYILCEDKDGHRYPFSPNKLVQTSKPE